MRCARCEFENIPGQTRCIRCGSILEGGAAVIEIYPPRMPAWKKPGRDALRWLRGSRLRPEKPVMPCLRRGFRTAVSDSLAGLLLSIVPGLGHALVGRFREVRLWVLLWAIALGLGLFLYGSPIGFPLIGLALGLHAWIAVQYGLFQEIQGLPARVGALIVIVLLLAVLYWTVPGLVPPGLSGGYTALTIPARNIHPGDYFVTRRLPHGGEPLARGALVLFQPRTHRFANRRLVVGQTHGMIGQVVGLPGEKIRIAYHTYAVSAAHDLSGPGAPKTGAGTERLLDPNQFPVPRWLQIRPPSTGLYIPADSYFVSSQYTINAHGNVGAIDGMIADACIIPRTDLRGRAFLQWWPLSRRRLLE
ncbi:MAG: S26 family signal peptidase [Planctomycetes bacterium]|jgi:hypothetical protein|nr:S26 family signal peptidase [Planctomycetota bacterium]